jgi:hypothetical protein
MGSRSKTFERAPIRQAMDIISSQLMTVESLRRTSQRRHCERSEAIQGNKEELDCFVASASGAHSRDGRTHCAEHHPSRRAEDGAHLRKTVPLLPSSYRGI